MNIYHEHVKKYDLEIIRLKKRLSSISLFRVLVFITAIAMVITLFSLELIIPLWLALPVLILCFNRVLKLHDHIAYRIRHAAFLKDINASEILRGKCELEKFDSGERFIDPDHPYTSDLDIFGPHSVFQLINRTTTESGMIRLAEWLSESASDTEIVERQRAIKELSGKLAWRQDFQAAGMHFRNKKSDYFELMNWVGKPTVLLKRRHIYSTVAIILPVLFIFSAYCFYTGLGTTTGVVYFGFMILLLSVNGMFLKKIRPQAEDIVETSTKNMDTLRGYRALIRNMESENFSSGKLQALRAVFVGNGYSASAEIGRICSILEFSHQRPVKRMPLGGNYMYTIVNIFLLLDIHLILATEKWKTKHVTYLKSWAEAVSEFEVLNSFAGFWYSNPSYTFPELSSKDNEVYFESLGHPLIAPDDRVCNDFVSEGPGNVVMITGSNMGGKSTFLRTVGVNLVLALAGAPCCATYARVSNLGVFTSMRTHDNLRSGISSFYAELHRIEKLLKLIADNRDIFFLLDEMLKGTNSEDRHKGGFSLIHQLSGLRTSGIIATHDIKLAQLAGDQKLVTNYSFNSEIRNKTMVFSYQLYPDICYDFNASAIMKNSGIHILSEIPDANNTSHDHRTKHP